jgi:putative ABC transport system ATP-binding protein
MVALPLFTSHDAGHTYGSGSTSVVAVRGVNCVIEAGARIALTGPSGSGKSTLLHMIAGLERTTRGDVDWAGLGGHPAARPHEVGVIFQGLSLIPSLDAVQNVALPLVLGGLAHDEAQARALASLGTLRLEALAHKLPDELSGGQSQRVAVARVLAAAPKMILADEPTGQLDNSAGLHVIDVLIEAADQLGAALVVSTHDPIVAARFPTRWTMHDGLLLSTDTGPAGDERNEE